MFRRIVGIRMVARVSVGVLYCVFVSVACAPRVGCVRVFRARAPSGGAGLVDG